MTFQSGWLSLETIFLSLLQNIDKNINSKIMWITKIAPKKFLGRFSLQQGALICGIFILIISIICVLSLAIEIVFYKKCKDCTGLVMHNVYSFSINAIIYCMCMIFVNVWFIWGVKYQKSSVVLSWVVITAMWWAQSFALVCILLGLYITDSSLGWIVAFACAIIAFIIFFYCILVGYGYWLEIRKSSRNSIPLPNEEPAILRN